MGDIVAGRQKMSAVIDASPGTDCDRRMHGYMHPPHESFLPDFQQIQIARDQIGSGKKSRRGYARAPCDQLGMEPSLAENLGRL